MVDGEIYRIHDESDYQEYEDLLDEHPLLLDPTEKRDTLLLTFTRNGQPAPSVRNEYAVGYRRAIASISIYHLDYVRLNKERQQIYYKINLLVKRVQRHQERWEKEHDRSACAFARAAFEEITHLIAPESQYSSAARAYLKAYRELGADWDWIDELLTSNI